jgi:hypothetical protein
MEEVNMNRFLRKNFFCLLPICLLTLCGLSKAANAARVALAQKEIGDEVTALPLGLSTGMYHIRVDKILIEQGWLTKNESSNAPAYKWQRTTDSANAPADEDSDQDSQAVGTVSQPSGPGRSWILTDESGLAENALYSDTCVQKKQTLDLESLLSRYRSAH